MPLTKMNNDDGNFVTTSSTSNVDLGAEQPSSVDNFNESNINIIKKTNKWALRGRLRSKVLWVAVLGGVIQIFSAVNLWAKIGITAEGFRELMVGVGAILEAFGVFNDPTNREGF